MQRILILGCPGSGKSTLARKLREKTGLPLVHLDRIWWREDGTHISREEFDKALADVLQESAWIIDGNYSRTYLPRLKACDCAVFLDYPESVCMEGILARAGTAREDCPLTQADEALFQEVRSFRSGAREALLDLLEQEKPPQVLIFQSREEAARWLDSL